MNVGQMLGFTKRFNEIKQSKVPRFIKVRRLNRLMDDIEDSFIKDPFADMLYRTVALGAMYKR